MVDEQVPPTFKRVELSGPSFFPEISKLMYSSLAVGDCLSLLREPDNKVDRLAVLACSGGGNGRPIAYVQRPINFELANWMDKGWIYLAQISGLRRGRFRRHLATVFPLGGPKKLEHKLDAERKLDTVK